MKLLSVSEKTTLFSFAAIFDPPHLLKCTCLFLKRNVANVECGITVNGERLTGTAQWDVMLKLYEFERCNMYRLLPKVTERHGGYNTIKVSLTAQIMNSTVAAAIRLWLQWVRTTAL